MPPLNALRRRGGSSDDEPDLLEPGLVVNTPATGSTEVYVTLDNFSTDQPVGPVYGWRALPEASWPQAGGRCLVALPPQGDAWLVGWEPA